jgi:hypothetical protein
MEDEMRTMSAKNVWELENIPKGPKQWDASGSKK